MKKVFRRSLIVESISIFFILLFLYTGASKLLDYEVSREQIAQTPLLEPVAGWVVWLLPVTEFIVSVLLFWPPWRRIGLYGSLCLMTLFTVYILYIFTIDKELPCSCGGIIEQLSWEGHLVFNIALIGIAIVGLVLDRKGTSLKRAERPPVAYS